MTQDPRVFKDCKYFSLDMWYRMRSPCAVNPKCGDCSECKDYEQVEQKPPTKFEQLRNFLSERFVRPWIDDALSRELPIIPRMSVEDYEQTRIRRPTQEPHEHSYSYEYRADEYSDYITRGQHQETLDQTIRQHMQELGHESRWPEVDAIIRRAQQKRLLRSHLRNELEFPQPDAHLEEIVARVMDGTNRYASCLDMSSNVRVFLVKHEYVEFIVFNSDAGEQYITPTIYRVPREFAETVERAINEDFLIRHGTRLTVGEGNARGAHYDQAWIDDTPRPLHPDMRSSFSEFEDYVRRHFYRHDP